MSLAAVTIALASAFEAALQEVRRKPNRVTKVVKEIASALFHCIGCDRRVSIYQWLEGIRKNEIVKLKSEAIHTFKRVIDARTLIEFFVEECFVLC